MEKYYYVIINKDEKTMKIRECKTCLAELEKEIQEEENIKTRFEVNVKYKFFFNGTENKINLNTIYKYAKNFKIIE